MLGVLSPEQDSPPAAHPLPDSFPSDSIDRRIAELVVWSRSPQSGLCLEHVPNGAAETGNVSRAVGSTAAGAANGSGGGDANASGSGGCSYPSSYDFVEHRMIHFIGRLTSAHVAQTGSLPLAPVSATELSPPQQLAIAQLVDCMTVRCGLLLSTDVLRYEFEDSVIGDYYECTFVVCSRPTTGSGTAAVNWILTPSPTTRVRRIEPIHPMAKAIAKRFDTARDDSESVGAGAGRSGVSGASAASGPFAGGVVEVKDLSELLRSRVQSTPLAVRASIIDISFPALFADDDGSDGGGDANGQLTLENCSRIAYIGCTTCGVELEPDANHIYRCDSCPLPAPAAQSSVSPVRYYYRPCYLTLCDAAGTVVSNLAAHSELVCQLFVVPPIAVLSSAAATTSTAPAPATATATATSSKAMDTDLTQTQTDHKHAAPPIPLSSGTPLPLSAAASGGGGGGAAAASAQRQRLVSDLIEIVRSLRRPQHNPKSDDSFIAQTFSLEILSRTVNDENGILIHRFLSLHKLSLCL